MNNVVKEIVDKCLNSIVEEYHIELAEEMSPNDPEFYVILGKRLENLNEEIIKYLEGE